MRPDILEEEKGKRAIDLTAAAVFHFLVSRFCNALRRVLEAIPKVAERNGEIVFKIRFLVITADIFWQICNLKNQLLLNH